LIGKTVDWLTHPLIGRLNYYLVDWLFIDWTVMSLDSLVEKFPLLQSSKQTSRWIRLPSMWFYQEDLDAGAASSTHEKLPSRRDHRNER
jgi:hypothetical protein